jgi:AcrR family transcriptional regulator
VVAVPRTRDRDRAAKILAAATRLFRERGFHAVGVDEIGAAAGITGPGVYRHFGGKEELLVRVLVHVTEDLWADLDEAGTLEDHVRSHVAYAVAHRDAIELWYQERRNLPAAALADQRRAQRRYVDRWVGKLRARRPELGEVEAGIVVRAAIGLIHAPAHAERPADATQLAPVLERMALAALLA